MHFLLLLFGEVRSASNWAPLCWFCSGGGAFCVVPGATLLVLLGGGAAGVARTGRFVKRHGKKEVRARNTQSKIKKRAERRGA